jgi:general nucleoside transport system permease protein
MRPRSSTLQRLQQSIVAPLSGLTVGWIAFAMLVWIYGESPRVVAGQLFAGTWGMPYGIGQVLYKSTALLLTGAAVDLALRARLFNIGAEGQLAVAGAAAGAVGASLPPSIAAWIALPVLLAVAFAAGALWAAPPALLRVGFGGHEVISSIMMNQIAYAAVGLALAHGLAIPGTVRTRDVVAGARLARFDALGFTSMHGSSVSLALPLAIAVVAFVSVGLARTRVGREIVLVGLGPIACAAEGIPVARRIAVAFLVSGGIAGLAAVAPVLGYKGYYESGLAAGAGFGGIAVALIGRGEPAGLALAALAFGTLDQGGLAINAYVPREVTTVIEGVVIVAVSLSDARVRRALGRSGA